MTPATAATTARPDAATFQAALTACARNRAWRAVVALTLANSGISVVFSYLSRDFYSALSA